MYINILHLCEHYKKQRHVVQTHAKVMTRTIKKKQNSDTRIESVHVKPTCLDIAPMYDGTVASSEVPTDKSMSDVVVDDMIENETRADFYVVEPLRADASPDILRALLEDALDTLSYYFKQCPTLPADGDNRCEPLPAAHAQDAAIVFPLKHCVFS